MTRRQQLRQMVAINTLTVLTMLAAASCSTFRSSNGYDPTSMDTVFCIEDFFVLNDKKVDVVFEEKHCFKLKAREGLDACYTNHCSDRDNVTVNLQIDGIVFYKDTVSVRDLRSGFIVENGEEVDADSGRDMDPKYAFAVYINKLNMRGHVYVTWYSLNQLGIDR